MAIRELNWTDQTVGEVRKRLVLALVTRQEAIALGLSVYTAGKPCKFGHGTSRYVCNYDCVVCAQENKKERANSLLIQTDGRVTFDGSVCKRCGSTQRYVRSHECVACHAQSERRRLSNNPEAKQRSEETSARSVKKHRQTLKDTYGDTLTYEGALCRKCKGTTRWVTSGECVPCQKERSRLYYERNQESVKAQSRAWAIANPEKKREGQRVRAPRYRHQKNASVRNRRAKLKKAEGTHTWVDEMNIFEAQGRRCALCTVSLYNKKTKKHEYHVDHIIPVSKGGTNWPNNIQVLCQNCNLRKQAKDPIDFARENGRLL